MAYSVSEADLVPMLAKCLLRHGSLEAVENFPDHVREQGGDATVCAEFIALNEIRRNANSEDLIRAAYEKAIQAATGALRDADTRTLESKGAGSLSSGRKCKKRLSWLIPVLAWLAFAVISISLEADGISPILLASIVASTAYLFGGSITNRRNEKKEQ